MIGVNKVLRGQMVVTCFDSQTCHRGYPTGYQCICLGMSFGLNGHPYRCGLPMVPRGKKNLHTIKDLLQKVRHDDLKLHTITLPNISSIGSKFSHCRCLFFSQNGSKIRKRIHRNRTAQSKEVLFRFLA